MVVAGGFNAGDDWSLETLQEGDEPIMVPQPVRDFERTTTSGTVLNENNVPLFGDIDCNEIADCCRVELVNHRGCSFGMKWLIQRWLVYRWLTTQFDWKKSLLKMGTPSPDPWDLTLYRQNVCRRARAAHAAPRHSGRWVGAPVASLRSRTLRPGECSLSKSESTYLFQPRLHSACTTGPNSLVAISWHGARSRAFC